MHREKSTTSDSIHYTLLDIDLNIFSKKDKINEKLPEKCKKQ